MAGLARTLRRFTSRPRTGKPRRENKSRLLRARLRKSVRQVRAECPDLLDLFGRRGLLVAFTDEERLITAPDQRRKAPFRHQAGRADVTERVLTCIWAALHKGDKAVALQDEMGSDLSRDNLNP